MKSEPAWMRDFRLKALDAFLARSRCRTGVAISAHSTFDDIHYYMKARPKARARPGTDVPEDIKNTFDKFGHPRGRAASSWPASGPSTSRKSSTTAFARTSRRRGSSSATATRVCASTPTVQTVLRHDHPVERQQVRRAELGGLERRLASSTCRPGSRWTSRFRPTSGSTPRTWASSSEP